MIHGKFRVTVVEILTAYQTAWTWKYATVNPEISHCQVITDT